jgi:hypothetical protein
MKTFDGFDGSDRDHVNNDDDDIFISIFLGFRNFFKIDMK